MATRFLPLCCKGKFTVIRFAVVCSLSYGAFAIVFSSFGKFVMSDSPRFAKSGVYIWSFVHKNVWFTPLPCSFLVSVWDHLWALHMTAVDIGPTQSDLPMFALTWYMPCLKSSCNRLVQKKEKKTKCCFHTETPDQWSFWGLYGGWRHVSTVKYSYVWCTRI